MSGIDQSEQVLEELLQPQFETSRMADLNDDDISKLIQLKTVLLLLPAVSSLSVIATATSRQK